MSSHLRDGFPPANGFQIQVSANICDVKKHTAKYCGNDQQVIPGSPKQDTNDHASVVYDNLYLDDPYTVEQLNDPSMIVARIQPLVDEFYNPKDITTGTDTYPQFKFAILRVLIIW